MEPLLIYYSSESSNTHRFVEQLPFEAYRIPSSPKKPHPKISNPYILICPTFAANDGQGAVPKQVIKFLNIDKNRELLLGVIASGNRNFGKYYGYAGNVISKKCNVPCLYKFELAGTKKDIKEVTNGVNKIWQKIKKA